MEREGLVRRSGEGEFFKQAFEISLFGGMSDEIF